LLSLFKKAKENKLSSHPQEGKGVTQPKSQGLQQKGLFFNNLKHFFMWKKASTLTFPTF
jgi:hypothetical protein